jgi:hypothetical protein
MAAFLHLGALAAGLLVNAAVQILSCRRTPGRGWVASFLSGFGAGFLALAALEAAFLPGAGQDPLDLVSSLCAVALAYAACGFFYFNVVNGGRSALRVRLLAELAAAPGGLTAEEILRLYGPDEMFAKRLERLLGHGQLVLRDGRCHIGRPAVVTIARLVTIAKRIVIGKESEFA